MESEPIAMKVALVCVLILALSRLPVEVAGWIDAPEWLGIWMVLCWGWEVVWPVSNKLFDWAKKGKK